MDEQINQPATNQAPQKAESSAGSLIGILIIVALIIGGGIYFLFLK